MTIHKNFMMILPKKIMKMMLVTALSITLSSCYTYFEPDIKSTPVVCMNSQITAGDTIKVEVTRTWRYSEGHPSSKIDIFLKDAEVYLYVNDEFEEKLELKKNPQLIYDPATYGNDSLFEAQYIPRSGDRIKLIAIDQTYGEAFAEVMIPYPVEIEAVKTTITDNESTYDSIEDTFRSSFKMDIQLTLTDPVSVSNYYIFDMQEYKRLEYDPGNNFAPMSAEVVRLIPDYSFEPIFSEHISPLETIITDAYGLYTVFSDRQISGKSYTLEIPVEGSYWCDYRHHPNADNKLTMDINLGHISTAYYNYLMSLWADTEGISGALGNVGLGDVVFEFSNVSTGAGIISARANSTVKLNIHDILKANQQ